MKKSLCENCGEPLFLDKDECREFLTEKLKEGYIVCSCCGVKQTTPKEEDISS